MAVRATMGRAWAWAWVWVWVWVWVVLCLVPPTLATGWDEVCPPGCKCTYASNRKLADCKETGFSTVPKLLSSEVQELNLAGNAIRYLEKDAFRKSDLVNLQKLYLQNNDVRSVHMDSFRGLSIMIELNLSGNRIDKLHPHTFTGMEKLRVLDLSNNLLSRLNGVQFPPLPHLRKLIFTSNRLTYIHNYAFTNLNLLESLKLSENQLKLLQPDLFINNTKLLELELHDNLWQCDCKLKPLVRWVKEQSLLQTHVTCRSPERVAGRKWEAVSQDELACRPELALPQTQVPSALGQNASLVCHATGDPLPSLKWVLHGRVLTNMSIIRYSDPEQRYVVRELEVRGDRYSSGGERQSSLTVTHVSEEDFTYYTCVADNLAGLVESNVSLIPAAPTLTGAITPKNNLDLYIIIAIAVGGLLLLIILIVLICCCVRRRQRNSPKPKTKVNGDAGGVTQHMEHKHILVVNPVEKPPRKYEQVPQTDMELALLNADPGAHRSYDDVDYPEAGPAHHRTPLATLDEEDDELPTYDTTLNLDTTATPSHSGMVADYIAHYPDLLDMTRPRAVSPTQLSYHSVVAPQFTTPGEYRYSYVHPAEYTPYPVPYVSPSAVQARPGYVTLPRRHRSPTWAGHPSTSVSPPPPMASDDTLPPRHDPVYDTLGPRTTADGTSRTDLTRPSLRAAEPFTPRTPQSPASPPSTLPPYYTPVTQASAHPTRFNQRNHSATLPRSTPNLLEDNSGLHLPPHELPQSAAARSRLTGASPTPSNASTLRTNSPAYRTANMNGSTTSKTPLDSSNESTLDSTLSINNTGKSDKNASSKKVPPKPPPKPSNKRLSVSSTSSDVPRKSSLVGENGRVFQDEGPDGTEV